METTAEAQPAIVKIIVKNTTRHSPGSDIRKFDRDQNMSPMIEFVKILEN